MTFSTAFTGYLFKKLNNNVVGVYVDSRCHSCLDLIMNIVNRPVAHLK